MRALVKLSAVSGLVLQGCIIYGFRVQITGAEFMGPGHGTPRLPVWGLGGMGIEDHEGPTC